MQFAFLTAGTFRSVLVFPVKVSLTHQYFIPDTDTTFIVLSEVLERDKKTPLSATIDYSLIRQDLKGNLLNEIYLGVFKGAFPFLPKRYQMSINDRDTLISTPRFDTLKISTR